MAEVVADAEVEVAEVDDGARVQIPAVFGAYLPQVKPKSVTTRTRPEEISVPWFALSYATTFHSPSSLSSQNPFTDTYVGSAWSFAGGEAGSGLLENHIS